MPDAAIWLFAVASSVSKTCFEPPFKVSLFAAI